MRYDTRRRPSEDGPAPGWTAGVDRTVVPAQIDRLYVCRLATLAAIALLALIAGAPASGAAAARYAAMAIDVNTGRILHSEAADEARYPASLTKMMTLYLVFERIEQGKLGLATRIAISANAADAPPSKLGLKAGGSIALGDAIKALVTKSANDIAVAIAEHIAGSETRFAQMMTAKAHELGMAHTTFRNPNGLPDSEQTTTARDMVLLGMRLYDHFPNHVRLFSLRAFRFAGRNYRNHNTMLDNFQGMEGMKTGYTRQSGYNLVASVRRDGRHVIAAVFGGQSGAARNARMRVILNRVLPQASRQRTRHPDLPSFRHGGRLIATARPKAGHVPALRSPPPADLKEPVRIARRPQPRADDPSALGWRASVRMAAPLQGATSVASATTNRAGNTGVPAGPAPPTVTVARVHSVSVVPNGAPARPSTGIRPPSSLQAQAQRLQGHSGANRIASRQDTATPGTALTSARASIGTTQIQVGAYAAESEARQRLEAVRQGAPALLAHAGIATPSVTVRGRKLYRARFVGFDADSATRTCNALRQRRIDCQVAR